jgi:parvulin-like peptidyl-prolyl isomerase
MRSRRLCLLAVLTALLVVTDHRVRADDVVARSGSITLTERAVRGLIEQADPRAREQLLADPLLLSQFVRSRLARMAILAEAKAKKWEQKPDVIRQIEQAHDDIIIDTYVASVSKPGDDYPGEAEVQAAYEANRSKFLRPRQYLLSQIFISVPGDSPKDAGEKAQKQLLDLKKQLRGGKADFADVARTYSDDKTSAAKGGELDWIAEDRLLPQIREGVAGLETGGVSEPVEAPDGWHLIKLLDTRSASVAPLDDVRQQLVAALRQQKVQDNANAFVAAFLRKNPVQLDEIALSKLTQK